LQRDVEAAAGELERNSVLKELALRGDAHVQIDKSICIYLRKHVFLSSELTSSSY